MNVASEKIWHKNKTHPQPLIGSKEMLAQENENSSNLPLGLEKMTAYDR